MSAAGDIRIGISGWTYAGWRGAFYPSGLPHRRELAYASSVFRSIEINGTFYSLQKPDSFARWADETPDDFIFAVKGPRYITHMRRLREPAAPIANFFASGLLRLGRKLGPILWQFPPNFRFDPALLRAFFELLPRDTDAAEQVARRHDHRLKARAWLRAVAPGRLRHAVEIRHGSFRDPAFIGLLSEQDIALVCADTVAWPRLMDVTADFAYCRLHGSQELYRSGYDDKALESWAGRARGWSTGGRVDGEFIARDGGKGDGVARDVFVFFDNTDKRRAPEDAKGLMRWLGQTVVSPSADKG